MFPRGSRAWLQFADPATWQLANDHHLGLEVLARHALRSGRRLTLHDARTVDICDGCGYDVGSLRCTCEGAGVSTVPAVPAVVLGLTRGGVREAA